MSSTPREIKFHGHRYVRTHTAGPLGRPVPTGQSADQTYQKARHEIDQLVAALKTKLDKHATEQRRDPKNWGFAGDLSHWRSLLEQIVREEH